VRRITRSFFGQMVNVTTCNVCGGAGQVIGTPCSTCRGDGRAADQTTLSVDIPAGVAEGNYIPIQGQGDAGRQGGAAGDCIVVIEEIEHEIFSRQDSNIVCQVPISFTTAALGGVVEILSLDGAESLSIPAGTQTGKLFRMRGKGIPHLRRKGRGDLVVQVQVWTPERITDADTQLLRKLAQSESFKPPKSSKTFFAKLRETLGV
jgi:molecular chaperone DnaJ